MHAEDVFLVLGIAQVGLLVWFIRGEIKVEKYCIKMGELD